MKIGTLTCKLFGHKFHAERVEYDPHYLKMSERGTAIIRTHSDFHMVGFQTNYCVRCGIDKNLESKE